MQSTLDTEVLRYLDNAVCISALGNYKHNKNLSTCVSVSHSFKTIDLIICFQGSLQENKALSGRPFFYNEHKYLLDEWHSPSGMHLMDFKEIQSFCCCFAQKLNCSTTERTQLEN